MHKWIKSTHPIHGTAVALGAAWLLATSASARLDACDGGGAGAADGQSKEVCAVAEAERMNCPVMARADKAAKACDAKMECRRSMAQACDAKEGDDAGAGACDGGEAGAADVQSKEVCAVAEAERMNCPVMARADKAAKACDAKMECRRSMAQARDAKEGDDAEAGACDGGGTAEGRDDVNDDTQ